MQAVADRLLGRTLGGRYELRSVTAQEHLGHVYAAWDHQTDGPVHVKVLNPAFVHEPRKFARFGREITATFLVAHPNAVGILDWGQQDDVHWLVTEALTAHPLADELAEGPLDPDRVARILAQVASAIGAAHQEGIVHRAIAPRNVLLVDGPSVVAKVRDFGMAKLETTEEDGATQTTLTTRVDDLAYMAPEYLNTGQFLKKSDLYSLGALGWHMLTGRVPPTGGVVAVPAPSRVVPSVPSWLDELVMELVDPDPNRRPSGRRVVQRVEDAIGEPVEARAPAPLAPSAPPDEEPHALAVVGGVAVIVGALIVGGAVIVSSGVALIVTLLVAA